MSEERSPQHGERGPVYTPESVRETYLSYQDAPLSEEAREQLREDTINNPMAMRYAEALTRLFENPETDVEAIANRLHQTVLREVHELGLETSPFTLSRSWVFWDLAKQHYLFEEAQAGREAPYAPEDWNEPEKLTEVENRHIGWEAYRNNTEGTAGSFLAHISQADEVPAIQSLLSKEAKANGTLSSKELAELGGLTRAARVEQPTPEGGPAIQEDEEDGVEGQATPEGQEGTREVAPEHLTTQDAHRNAEGTHGAPHTHKKEHAGTREVKFGAFGFFGIIFALIAVAVADAGQKIGSAMGLSKGKAEKKHDSHGGGGGAHH